MPQDANQTFALQLHVTGRKVFFGAFPAVDFRGK